MRFELIGGVVGVCLLIGTLLAIPALGWSPLCVVIPGLLLGGYIIRTS